MIIRIKIKNFRSILDIDIPIEEITTFVGENDAGKSNIFLALNLIFNGKTQHLTDFEFKSDYNKNTAARVNKAKEIVIELTLKLPKTYRRDKLPDTVYWRKIWRKEGLVREREERGYVNVEAGNKKTSFLPKSRIPKLLDNINFTYIPAVKDQRFFVDLQGKLYEAISGAAEESLITSSMNFESKIQEQFIELTSELDINLASENKIKLPGNLRRIFEDLEFSSNDVPLSRRGDGIKIRHIPTILRFISNKMSSLHKEVIKPQIWGFEEPENNVEFSTCYKLVDQFITVASEKTQILITTHSPAIYSIAFKNDLPKSIKTKSFFVRKNELNSVANQIEKDQMDESMGILPIIAPYIEKTKREWKERYDVIHKNMEDLKAKNFSSRIFCEGKSDYELLEKFLIENYSHLLENYTLDKEWLRHSANSATDRAISFHLLQKHSARKPNKTILILDSDTTGAECKSKFNKTTENCSSSKCFTYKPIAEHIDLRKKGFNFSTDLESLMPIEIWKLSEKRGWLEANPDIQSICSGALINKIISQEIIFGNLLSEYQRYLINYRFTDTGKEKLSKMIQDLDKDDEILTRIFENYSVAIADVIAHLSAQ